MTSNEKPKGEIIIYKSPEGPELQVKLQNETVWMPLQQIADLFGRDKSVISRHITNVFKTAELRQNSVVAKFATVQTEGRRLVEREVEFYNLDLIISVGYRVNSQKATQFRIWATQRLRDYIIKGFVINEHRLPEAHVVKLKELETAHKLMISFSLPLMGRVREG